MLFISQRLRKLARSISSAPVVIFFVLMPHPVFAQDVSVTRLPIDTDMAVRLTNLTTHVNYDRSGNSFFIIPAGRYSVQLLRNGQVAYQEVEYIDANSPDTRTINPNKMEIVVGIAGGSPQFDPSICGALESAAQLAIRSYGLSDASLKQRLATAKIDSSNGSCTTPADIDDLGQTVAGSYGVTPLGLVALSIEYTLLGGQHRPRNQGNSPVYRDPSTQRLATTQQSRNFTPSLVTDLQNGISDVAFDADGKPLLVCAALDANTPVFCDSNGFAVATPAIARLRGLYRFSAKTSPVDHQGAELDHWTTFVHQDESDATQDGLAKAVSGMKTKLEARINQVQGYAVSTSNAAGQSSSERRYPTPDIVTLITSTQADFDQALSDAKLQPLRQHFPAEISHLTDPAAPTTSELETQRVFRELKNTISVLDSVSDSLAIDLVFRTSPVETEGGHLNFVSCKRCTPIVSQGGLHRFYRGKYYIQATLDGYVAYEGWLDLVEDQRHILECDLVRIRRASQGRSSSCSLRAQ